MALNRRQFLSGLAAAGGVMAAGPLLGGCATAGPRPAAPAQRTGLPAPWMATVLYHAAMAPSGHNSQPWQVVVEAENRWVVRIDSARQLPAVDPEARESLLSVGAFLEALSIAAAASGRRIEISVQGRTPLDPQLARVTVTPMAPADRAVAVLRRRRTVKSGMRPREIDPADVSAAAAACGGRLAYFPRGSRHARCIAEGTLAAFRHQSAREDAQRELAKWVRLTPAAAARHGDGLTPAGMEVGGIARAYMRYFMTPDDVTGTAFRDAGIDKTARQVTEGGGWMVISSPGSTVADIVTAGRRFLRLALLARERSMAVHPMTQILEEPRWRSEIARLHGPDMIPQFVLRVGYLDHYPAPVSPRRPWARFVRLDQKTA